MGERPKLDWFRVRDEAAFERLPAWIKRQPVNTYSGLRQDKRGDWIFLLGYDRKPDSDWGRFEGHRAAIWFASEALADMADPFIRRGLGWPDAPSSTLTEGA